jgi:hypothetical protein
MQTPRRSGQPINAGDFVLTRTCSLPIRTSCENVGTVRSSFSLGRIRGKISRKLTRSSRKAHLQKHTRAHSNAERSTANPEKQARNSADTPRRKNCASEFLLGEAYSAFRGWHPIPAALLSHSIVHCSGTEDIPFQLHWAELAPTNNRV